MLTEAGEVLSSGWNRWGQLGAPSLAAPAWPGVPPVYSRCAFGPVPALAGARARAVAAGAGFSAVVVDAGPEGCRSVCRPE